MTIPILYHDRRLPEHRRNLSQWLIDQGIREVDGAIVMDPLAIGIKTAELMVDLEHAGIKRYRSGQWAVPSEEVRNMLAGELGVKRLTKP